MVVVVTALLRFGDMRSNILWFFFLFGFASHQNEQTRNEYIEEKHRIISPHSVEKEKKKAIEWQIKSIPSDEQAKRRTNVFLFIKQTAYHRCIETIIFEQIPNDSHISFVNFFPVHITTSK